MSTKLPRGVRNNNPGNIRRSSDKWVGMADDQSGDAEFVVFKAPEWGIRALARLLIKYEKMGFDTVRKIISRYAPSNENDTEAYIRAVSRATGFDPDEVIDVDQFEVMKPLVEAIIAHECAGYRYPDKVVVEGLRLAGVADTPQASFIKKAGAQVTAGVAVCCAAVSEHAEPLKKAAGSLADFTGAPIIANVSTWLLTAAGAATLAGLLHHWLKHRKGL